jgi:uncharacterized protein (TIGR03118 family)
MVRAGAAVSATALIAALASATPTGAVAAHRPAVSGNDGHGGAFRQVNLVSDVPGRAQLLDNEVKNPWGIAMGPTTPLWVNNNFNPASACNCIPQPEDLLTKATLYAGANKSGPITKIPLEVTTSSPTGMVFNPTKQFKIDQGGTMTPALFLFNEAFIDASGTDAESVITGWSPADPLPTTTTPTAARQDHNFPVGLALVPGGMHRGARLLVANGNNGRIVVYGRAFHQIMNRHLFVDPMRRADGLDAYNVMFLNHRVYVSYFKGRTGAVSVFTPGGRFIKRLVTGAPLVGPWGMAIAPKHWGEFGGALLVGNVDNGKINAFNRHTGKFLGTLKNRNGRPLVNPGLWGIEFGNGVIGTPHTLIFAAGIGSEVGGFGDDIYEHGLIGLIRPIMNDD